MRLDIFHDDERSISVSCEDDTLTSCAVCSDDPTTFTALETKMDTVG